MELKLAKTAGFCFGVNRAIKMMNDAISTRTDKRIYSLGPIIHNKKVVDQFIAQGVKVIDDIKEVEDNSILVIRAHGISPVIYQRLSEKNVEIIDTTCPFVKKIHSRVAECSTGGYGIVIVGDREHPEVKGIKGWDENAVVVGSEEEAKELSIGGKVCIVAQTTLSKEKWNRICDILEKNIADCEVFNTICNATSERQHEAEDLAKQVEVMLVIGDPNSSNTRKLHEICKKHCQHTYLIEDAGQLGELINKEGIFLQPYQDSGNCIQIKVGITAGASTPDRIIKEVIDKMNEINKPVEEGSINQVESPDQKLLEEEPTQANEPAEIEKTNEEEMSFEQLFESSMKTIEDGQILKGRVISVTNKEVFVDLGYKADGIIPLDEFSDNPEEKPAELYKAGDEIKVLVVKVNDGEGNVLLSRKRIEYIKAWDMLAEAHEKGTYVKGTVSDIVNGGILVLVNGAKVFVPASLVSDRYVNDLNQYIKKPMKLKIIDFNRQKKKAVGSHRAVLQEERQESRKNLWETLEVGQIIKGTVKRIADFGVFVDIGGIDGLIHVSELSWNRIKHPSEVVKEGQEIEVKVLDINKEKEKVSLGYRKDVDDPWQSAINEYEVGKVVTGKVVNMMPFGAFVEFEKGLTGLVHVSQISNKRINKPQEVLELGQEVEAKITEIDMEKKKISLSIKEILPAIIDEKADKIASTQETEIIPDQHKEELKLTLGDLVDNKIEKGTDEKEIKVEEKKADVVKESVDEENEKTIKADKAEKTASKKEAKEEQAPAQPEKDQEIKKKTKAESKEENTEETKNNQ